MATGEAILILCFAVMTGVAISLWLHNRQLEERIVQLRAACDGKDFTIVALAQQNRTLQDIAFGPFVPEGGPVRAQIITLVPHDPVH